MLVKYGKRFMAFCLVFVLLLSISNISVLGAAPAAPTGLTAAPQTSPAHSILVSWAGVGEATSYIVSCNGINIATVGTTQYLHGERDVNIMYSYSVRAVNADGVSESSSIVNTYLPESDRDDFKIFYKDGYGTGVAGNNSYNATITENTSIVANGTKSQKIRWSEKTASIYNGVLQYTLTGGATMDLTELRATGGIISFWVYVPSGSLLSGITVRLNASTSNVVALSGYVTERDKWQYVAIPISAFPIASPTFNYASVNKIEIFAGPAKYLPEYYEIYVDDFTIKTGYKMPVVENVTTNNSISITSGSTISPRTTGIDIPFNYDMDPSTINKNNVK